MNCTHCCRFITRLIQKEAKRSRLNRENTKFYLFFIIHDTQKRKRWERNCKVHKVQVIVKLEAMTFYKIIRQLKKTMHSPSLHWIKLQNFLKKQFLKFEEKKVWKKNCRISQLLRVYILFGYQIRFFTLVFYIGTNHLCVDFERCFIQNSLNKLLFTTSLLIC